jgi:hypothetical protein
MKRFRLLSLSTGTLLLAATSHGQSFILNGGFESPISPSEWTLSNQYIEYRTQAAALTATEGVQFAGFNTPGTPASPTGQPDGGTHITQYVNLDAGSYSFSFDLASASLGNSVVHYELTAVDPLSLAPIGSPALGGTAEALTTGPYGNPELYWTYDAGGTFALSTPETMRVRFYVNGSYLDGIQLTAVPEVEETAAVGALALGAFVLFRRKSRK